MAPKTSVDQYGRKTWDVEAYAQEARLKRQKRRDESGEELPQSPIGLERDQLIESLLSAVQDFRVISSDANKYKVGFECPVCQLLFRDNMALVDHFNLPQHLRKVGKNDQSAAKSTLAQVTEMLEKLINEKHRKDTLNPSFQERVNRRIAFEHKIRERRRRQKKKKKDSKDEVHDPCQVDMKNVLGFSGFGTQNK